MENLYSVVRWTFAQRSLLLITQFEECCPRLSFGGDSIVSQIAIGGRVSPSIVKLII